GSPQVDRVSGKVFFSLAAPAELRQLRSAERLFLLLKKSGPMELSRSKGKMLHEIKSLVVEEPKYWLDIISVWRNLRGHGEKTSDASGENPLALKRKSEEEATITNKRQKTEEEREVVPEEGQECCRESQPRPGEGGTEDEQLSFRVSCRCSGAIAKLLTPQEVGRAVGTALSRQCGWRADLRDPDLEIFVHLNDVHSVVGIPLFRVPLANREYIRTAGLRSTVAWAMASLAEISAGALVLDPMCGLGTILLEAAKEWPEASYWGADVSDSQLEGAGVNIRTAGLADKIELLKASVKALPLPSGSVDSVISDIPFGKKFKLRNDAQDILQEMERVLRVGGTMVLLLSQDLCRLMDSLTKGAGSDSPVTAAGGTREGAAPASPGAAGNSSSSSSSMDGVTKPFPSSSRARLGSLVQDGVHRVSLGRTDAFIYKCRKVSSAGSR
ncbi:THUM2 protein, partial [Pitta sordida]|nr:THUM2 protein [Pitta sordida]